MSTNTISSELSGYQKAFREKDYQQRGPLAQNVADSYYGLVTEFYEKGWGQSFHFAPRYNGEDFKASIARHEFFLASRLGLAAGDSVLDAGCGVMGPARNIARISGAHITGLTINQYQVERCKKLNAASTVSHLLDVKQGDFMNIPFADNSFDKVYAIEALCHAPDLVAVYRQIYNKLKPGGKACFYEWAMTPLYNSTNKEHNRIKQMIEYGNGVCELNTTAQIDTAIEEVGFIKAEVADLAQANYGNNIPWYSTLQSGWSLSQLRHTKLGRSFMQATLNAAEFLHVVPQGVGQTHKVLLVAADGLVAGGEQGIFTPMYMVLVHKPLT